MNPNNSYQSRLQGMALGNPQDPVSIGSYRFHLIFDSMKSAIDNIDILAPEISPTIVTTLDRPNMYLVYDPAIRNKCWVQWEYWQYVKCEIGYYGNNYFLFGNGKHFEVLPSKID